MNIQLGIGLSSYQGIGKVGASPLGGFPAKNPLDGANQKSGAAGSTEQVTISDAAKALASKNVGATQGRTVIQERLLKSADSDPQSAEKLAYDMANTPSTIFYDIRDQLASGKMGPVSKLSSTGQIVDEAYKAKFTQEASVIDAQRKAIYDTEKSKGTPASEIVAKMIDFTNKQSRNYLEATCWTEKAS